MSVTNVEIGEKFLSNTQITRTDPSKMGIWYMDKFSEKSESNSLIPIEPTGYRMLVKQVVQENKTESGIILATDEEHERQQRGFPLYEVLAQGPACYKDRESGEDWKEGKWCNVGDIVLMDSYSGKSYAPEEFMRYNETNEEATKELKEMQRLNLRFHLVNDDNVMGVLKK